MHTDTTVQRSAPRPEPKVELRVGDSTTDYLTLAQSLAPGQVRAVEQVLAPLDRANAPIRIGFFGPRHSDRDPVIEYLVRPGSSRRMRTPEHRKVIGLRLDTTAVPDGMQPWHYLVFSVIQLLTEGAMPSERSALNEMRNELTRLARMHRRDEAGAAQAAVPFVRRFQSTFPKLVVNTVSLANSVLLIVLDRLDEAEPADSAQWLEAAQFFCSAAGSVILVSANENALLDRLNQSAAHADGRSILQTWMTRRVEISNANEAAPAASRAVQSIRAPASPDDNAGAGHNLSVPAASARIIREALAPDTTATINAMAQWRVAMRAVLRRTQEGLSGSITPTLVAKLVALRALAPGLYDAARYDAQMLTSVERSARGDKSSDGHAEWMNQVTQQPRLGALFAAEPSFNTVDLRDLATALRLTNTVGEVRITEEDGAALRANATDPVAARRIGASAAARTFVAAARSVEGRMTVSAPLLFTAFAGAGVFLIDRIVKLLIQSALHEPGSGALGGLIRPEFLAPNSLAGTAWGGSLAVAAELFGLALAVLIAIFWGSAQEQQRAGHSFSLGLIIGALGANLFDRLAYGSVLNYLHVGGLPVFNLSHVALITGAMLLAYTLARAYFSTPNDPSPARPHQQPGN